MIGQARPRTSVKITPPDIAGGAGPTLLDWRPWSYYSTAALPAATALPASLPFFNYVRGQNISGSGAAVVPATRWHTNMETDGAMPNPVVMQVRQIRCILPPLTWAPAPTLCDGTSGTNPENNDQFDDLRTIIETGVFVMDIGSKRVVEVPLRELQQQVGIGGTASVAVTTHGTAAAWATRIALHRAGRGFQLPEGAEIILKPLEPFTVSILWGDLWATAPSTIDAKLITIALDGSSGRPIQ